MAWKRRMLRGKLVYAKAGSDGELVSESGRIEIVYQLGGNGKVYRASAKNLSLPNSGGDELIAEEEEGTGGTEASLDPNGIVVYTDGACSGNPGPMGAGAVLLDRGERTEISEFLGEGTNNIAELTAILLALEKIPSSERNRPVFVHTDSSYSIGVLSKNWKAKANVELIAQIREVVAQFSSLSFIKGKGHAGIPENERCDELAVQAVENAK